VCVCVCVRPCPVNGLRETGFQLYITGRAGELKFICMYAALWILFHQHITFGSNYPEWVS